MRKFLFDKYLSYDLFPFCFRLFPTASGKQRDITETTGTNQTQIGCKIGAKLFYNNGLQICVRDSAGGK